MPFPAIAPETLRRFDVPAPRYTSYPTVPEWSEAFGPSEYAEALREAARSSMAPLSLYVHLPFCREMCLYCGCNVVVASTTKAADPYLHALSGEMALVAGRLDARRTVKRVHLGGGTPTFLTPHQLRALGAAIRAAFDLEPGADLSVEVDPAVTTRAHLEALRELGFRRISMGVQDLDPAVQEAVRRRQSCQETQAIVASARELGFRSVNLDLIFGLPRQTSASWSRTLEQIVELRPDRIAAFSFAYVPEARPHQRLLPAEAIPGSEAKLELLRITHDRLCAAGYLPIGMDHFALPEDELARAAGDRALWRDFQGYTVDVGCETVAVGVTGIGDVGGCFAQNVRSRTAYMKAIAAGRLPTERGLRLTAEDARRRAVITALFCNFQVDLGPFAQAEWGPELEDLADLERVGLVLRDRSSIVLTPLGRVFVRNVAMVFDARLRARAAGERPVFSRAV